ncbi:sensor histidine kinase KdpD [Ktedonosporobacter rubrisoli]|uniref:Sensor histidine kinase KdpD n=1 Tax=Ktedonosporobacter rubrisoli TaxID=2509675 RepID=A0A4V0YYY7_KTERU|nr:universal stress protein [Ktedonosporobacter rubrisoli]QBD77861.1 sensor histidine kinase KdpD [Ktedonosporobacter rubrisoli]
MEQNADNARREEGRPDPEALLKHYNLRDADLELSAPDQAQPSSRRGRLRVYLGAAAGVGKTYAMLNEGHRRKERGRDVVVGYVETHARPQTMAQLRDLEVIPRKQVIYRGVTFEEMDTEAILARHPQVVLVDELAHTNVPGSRHIKRYQDVEELLAAGINIVTTLNIQHLESLNDLVTSITGVRIRETLPDSILDQADEVELIDIAPYALRQRMKHGNIYPPERIEAALNNFFREGNLTALRELALRRTAEKTESQLEQYMTEHGLQQNWSARERVLVGFDHRPQSRQVIRAAWRLAHGLHADLFALYIQPEGYLAFVRSFSRLLKYGKHAGQHWEEAQRSLEEHALLAEDLGAEVIRVKSSDIAITLAEIAQQRHITQIVLGQPARSSWEELLYGSVVNRLLRLTAGKDIHLVPLVKNKPDEEKP